MIKCELTDEWERKGINEQYQTDINERYGKGKSKFMGAKTNMFYQTTYIQTYGSQMKQLKQLKITQSKTLDLVGQLCWTS